MTRRLAPATAAGFTLVEVMIAIGITAVIGAMALGAFQRAYAARDLVEAQDERYSGARLALGRLAREVSMAYLSEHYDHKRYRERPTIFRGKDGGDRDELLFTMMAHERLVRDERESDQALVEYSLESDPEFPGEQALLRREKARIDDDPTRGGTTAVLCQHVTAFDVEYWDWKKQEWVREWSSASVERQGTLPTRARFRLRVKMPDGKEERFEAQARIAIIRPLDF